jgi:hypothetical protein
MLNSRGLGEQVQRKKEAYQSNPQALQQQYQQSQQLVDAAEPCHDCPAA